MNPIDMDRLAIDRVHVGQFKLFPDFGGDTHRPEVIGVDEADEVTDLGVGPGPCQRTESGLGRKSLIPA